MIYNRPEYWLRKEITPPDGDAYLTFSSPNKFNIGIYSTTKNWDGTLEYFAGTGNWTTWDGTTTISSINIEDGNYIYLRGTGNTKITGSSSYNDKWSITGTDVRCSGDIDALLDYATVEAGERPTMANNCYFAMFYNCTALTQAPELPATALTNYCYYAMFKGCTSLTQAPSLPATTLTDFCYHEMFQNCTSLTQAPSLPATTLCYCCYSSMFQDCTSLTQTPSLPATRLGSNCYQYMFKGCTSLTQAPSLPATTLASYCYYSMFQDCTSLTQAPSLPATTLIQYCYSYMFSGCTSLTQVPSLPATRLIQYCYSYMFQGCTKIKLSTTKTGEYTLSYRIPKSGTGTTATSALSSMFTSTGGTFKGTPSINKTYCLSNTNTIV